MKIVERFRPMQYEADMEQHHDGEWIHATDYDALHAEAEALRKRARTAEREASQALRTLKGLKKVAKVVDANSDQVCGENNLLRQEVEALRAIVDKAWNRSHALSPDAYIPGALDAWKRPVKQHLPYDFSGNPGAPATQYCNGWNDAGGYWKVHCDDLAADLEALRAENGRLRETERALIHNHNLHVEKLEAARGLLRDIFCTCNLREMPSEYAIRDISNQIEALLTATPSPEVRHEQATPNASNGAGCSHLQASEQAEQGKRQEAVHWRAVLSPAEVPMQLNVHEHVAGFTDRRKAEDWIAARLQMDGWHYTLEALYPGPQPGPDVRGLVEALEQISKMDERSVVGSITPIRQTQAIAMRALATHRQAQQGGSDGH